MPRTHKQRLITYRDHQRRVWYVSEVARLKVVSPAIDGPNVALVIRFEREGEERLARWIGGDEWRRRSVLHRLFAEAEPGEPADQNEPVPTQAPGVPAKTDDTGVGAAPPALPVVVECWIPHGSDDGSRSARQVHPRDVAQFDACLRASSSHPETIARRRCEGEGPRWR